MTAHCEAYIPLHGAPTPILYILFPRFYACGLNFGHDCKNINMNAHTAELCLLTDVAGVTFMAIGSSTLELFSSIIRSRHGFFSNNSRPCGGFLHFSALPHLYVHRHSLGVRYIVFLPLMYLMI
ncbi:UNVERIFIED_CONTAM: hypothetical protein NCL1_28896 [Trichonephila clavipes]